jgi:hypothetical protein
MDLVMERFSATNRPMTSVITYKGYSVLTAQAADGRWSAKIHRLDSKFITNAVTGDVRAVVETRPPQYIEKDATALATRAIDGGSLR